MYSYSKRNIQHFHIKQKNITLVKRLNRVNCAARTARFGRNPPPTFSFSTPFAPTELYRFVVVFLANPPVLSAPGRPSSPSTFKIWPPKTSREGYEPSTIRHLFWFACFSSLIVSFSLHSIKAPQPFTENVKAASSSLLSAVKAIKLF